MKRLKEYLHYGLTRLDWSVVLLMLGLLSVGLTFIYSASARNEDLPDFFGKQIFWAAAGFVVFFACACANYRALRDYAWPLYGASLVLLVLVLVMGTRVYGATRWLNVFGLQVQPSEFAKISTVIMLARYLGDTERDMSRFSVVVTAFAITAVPFLLIVKEPDLGTAMVLLPAVFIMMYAAGVPMRTLLLLGVAALLCLSFGWFLLDDYQKERVLVFMDPGRDPLGAGWNKIQSAISVGSGGLWGKGFMKGTQNVLGFLPRTVAPTDFIYSVIAEEMGFLGSLLILSLFSALFLRMVAAAFPASDRMGRLLVIGVTALLLFHTVVNIAMTVGLMPITGVPLPLISYGGSFMISTMAGLGLVQSVYVRRVRR